MLSIVAILLFFGVVVRHKWRNAAAKKEEILRLVAMASEEEVQIAKLESAIPYNSPPPPVQLPAQFENRYYCAVCYSPTTTRCSRCKAVRYCSGKCQILHWRQGHKDECQPAIVLCASKESGFDTEAASLDQFEMHASYEFNGSGSTQAYNGFASSSTSVPYICSSTVESETSLGDLVTVGEVVEAAGTPNRSVKESSDDISSETYRTSHDSDGGQFLRLPSLNFAVYTSNKNIPSNKIRKKQASKAEGIRSTSSRDERTSKRTAAVDPNVPDVPEQPSNFASTFSSAENQENEAELSKSKEVFFRRSGNHQVPSADSRSSRPSSSSNPSSSAECWKTETALYKEVEDVPMLSKPAARGLRTSVRKLVQQFRVSKQPKYCTFDSAKDSYRNTINEDACLPKFFEQLYSCPDLELEPFGLVNCGNSCYANAVLQCLVFTRPITSYLLHGLHAKPCCRKDWCFICEFECLILKGQELRYPLSPIRILSQIQKIGSHLSHGREEDAHEFLRGVVDTMLSICLNEASAAGPSAEDSTLIGLTFGGYLQSKIKCMKCSGRSERCDRMMDLTVEIDGNIDTLEEALAQFTASETLVGDDKYNCSRCKSYEKAKKKLAVLEAPNILTISLKRFRSGNLEKLNKLVQFPEVLNLAPYMSGTKAKFHFYHLYALVVHLDMMNAPNSGHYISYVKDFRGYWFRIDDSRVIAVELETVLSEEAYILFYERDTPEIPSLVRNSNGYSDGKTTRNMEAISSSNSGRKRNSKMRPSFQDRHADSTMLHQSLERNRYWMASTDFTGNHRLDPDDWRFQSTQRNHILDYPSSDTSSIFSLSDASSYSTDSTKESSAEEISGYIFGPSWSRP